MAIRQPAPGSDARLCDGCIFIRPDHGRTLVLTGWAGSGRRPQKGDTLLSNKQANTNGVEVKTYPFPPPASVGYRSKRFPRPAARPAQPVQLVSPVIFGALFTLFLLRGNGGPSGGRGKGPGWLIDWFKSFWPMAILGCPSSWVRCLYPDWPAWVPT